MKRVNYKVGALKRKFQTGKNDQPPGTFVSMAKNQTKITNKLPSGTTQVIGVLGLI